MNPLASFPVGLCVIAGIASGDWLSPPDRVAPTSLREMIGSSMLGALEIGDLAGLDSTGRA